MKNVKTVMEFPDGFKWVDLGSHACLSRESDIMGHCVGGELNPETDMRDADTSYWPLVEKGAVRILSLRDPKNEPHITVELGAKYNEDEVEANAVNYLALDLGIVEDNDHFHEVFYDRQNIQKLWKRIVDILGTEEAETRYSKYYREMTPTPGEDTPWVVNQIKGKANEKPKPQYQPYLVKLLNQLDMHVQKDRHHIDAVKKSKERGFIDLDELQSGQDLHFERTLKLVDREGTYKFGDVSSVSGGSGGLQLGGTGSLVIDGTDVRSVKNVDVGSLELRNVPGLTFNGETVMTKDAATDSSASLIIEDSKVIFGPSVRGLDYNGLHITRSTVLNMPRFITRSQSARSSVTIENSIVEFPEVTTYMDNEETWGSLGMNVFFKYSKIKLPKTLGAIDQIAFHGSTVSLKSVEWLNLQNDLGQLVITGTKIDGLPKKVKVGTIVTDQPDQVAGLITDNMEVNYIRDGRNKIKYKITREGDKNVVTPVEEKIRDDKGGLGHSSGGNVNQGIDARGYGDVATPGKLELP